MVIEDMVNARGDLRVRTLVSCPSAEARYHAVGGLEEGILGGRDCGQ